LDLLVESPWGIPGRSFLFSWGFPPGVTPRKPPFLLFFRCSLPVACGRLPFHDTPASHGLSA